MYGIFAYTFIIENNQCRQISQSHGSHGIGVKFLDEVRNFETQQTPNKQNKPFIEAVLMCFRYVLGGPNDI